MKWKEYDLQFEHVGTAKDINVWLHLFLEIQAILSVFEHVISSLGKYSQFNSTLELAWLTPISSVHRPIKFAK